LLLNAQCSLLPTHTLAILQFNPLELVYLGDDTIQEIQGEGDVYITLLQHELISICKVVYIPNLKKLNLFSINILKTITETFTSKMEYVLSKTL